MDFIDDQNISTFQVFRNFVNKYKQVIESKYPKLVNQSIKVVDMDCIDEALNDDFWYNKHHFVDSPYSSHTQKVFINDNTDSYLSINLTDEEKHALIAHEIGHINTSLNNGGPVLSDDENEADDFACSIGLKMDLINALEKLAGVEKSKKKKDKMINRIERLNNIA